MKTPTISGPNSKKELENNWKRAPKEKGGEEEEDVKSFVKQLEEQQDKNTVQKPIRMPTMRLCSLLASARPMRHPKHLEQFSWRAPIRILSLAKASRLSGRSSRLPELVTLPQCVIYYFNMVPQSKFEKQRWHERQVAEACEAVWIQNFHRSALNYSTDMPSGFQ